MSTGSYARTVSLLNPRPVIAVLSLTASGRAGGHTSPRPAAAHRRLGEGYGYGGYGVGYGYGFNKSASTDMAFTEQPDLQICKMVCEPRNLSGFVTRRGGQLYVGIWDAGHMHGFNALCTVVARVASRPSPAHDHEHTFQSCKHNTNNVASAGHRCCKLRLAISAVRLFKAHWHWHCRRGHRPTSTAS